MHFGQISKTFAKIIFKVKERSEGSRLASNCKAHAVRVWQIFCC